MRFHPLLMIALLLGCGATVPDGKVLCQGDGDCPRDVPFCHSSGTCFRATEVDPIDSAVTDASRAGDGCGAGAGADADACMSFDFEVGPASSSHWVDRMWWCTDSCSPDDSVPVPGGVAEGTVFRSRVHGSDSETARKQVATTLLEFAAPAPTTAKRMKISFDYWPAQPVSNHGPVWFMMWLGASVDELSYAILKLRTDTSGTYVETYEGITEDPAASAQLTSEPLTAPTQVRLVIDCDGSELCLVRLACGGSETMLRAAMPSQHSYQPYLGLDNGQTGLDSTAYYDNFFATVTLK